MKINNAKKALIHVAKGQTGMTEGEYRAFLQGFGVKSSKDLDEGDFGAVMQAFEALGFKPKVEVGGVYTTTPENKSKLWRTLRSLLGSLDLPLKYADAMARRMFGVEKVWWCTPSQIYKINGELMRHKGRLKRRGKLPKRNTAVEAIYGSR